MNIQKLSAILADYRKQNRHTIICKENCSPFKVNDVKKVIAQIEAKRAKRIKSKLPTVREQIWEKQREKANYMARSLPYAGYSMGQYNKVYINKLGLLGNWNDAEQYAKSSKYKATHGEMILRLSAKEFLKSRVVGGMITIVGEQISKDLFTCKWVQGKGSKNHAHIIFIDGYIFRDYHFVAENISHAKIIAKDKKQKLVQLELQKKAEQKLKTLCEKLPLNRIFVEVQDSLNAGNCLPGTQNFAQRNNIDLSNVGAVRADYIYSRRNGSETFVLKAIEAAKVRYINNGLITL